MVYEKSALGFMEFSADKRTLGVRERQVLLLVNGVRNLDDLAKFFKQELLQDTIRKLEAEGYIQLHLKHRTEQQAVQPQSPQAGAFSGTLPFSAARDQAQPMCPVKLATVKSILIDAADDYLGIMGRGIKARIEACDNENSLRQCISSWHMAMRESKLGRESASFLMEQIQQTLDDRMMGAESNGLQQH